MDITTKFKNFVNCKLSFLKDTPVYENPDTNNVIDKIFADDKILVCTSYIYWSNDEQCFYQITTPSGKTGYIRTDCIKVYDT